MNPRAIVEAALFSAGKALTPEELARTTRLEPDVIREHLRALSKEYTKRESAIEVAQIGTKWTMQIRSDYSERARAFAPPEIDRDLLKTAALIAYHQPLLQSDLFDMIGSKVYEHTKGLEARSRMTRPKRVRCPRPNRAPRSRPRPPRLPSPRETNRAVRGSDARKSGPQKGRGESCVITRG